MDAQPGQRTFALCNNELSAGAAMADITELIAGDHQRLLRWEAALRDAGRGRAGDGSCRVLAALWGRVAALLDLHADAEQEICHLPLAAAGPDGLQEAGELAADLWDIHEAVSEARLQAAGSPPWWLAVNAALTGYQRHHDRLHRGLLASFALRAGRAQRERLAAQWLAFQAARIRDLNSPPSPDGRTCPLCRWPLPATHSHILDAAHRAVLCTCPPCPALLDHARWDQRALTTLGVTASTGIHHQGFAPGRISDHEELLAGCFWPK